MKTYWHPLPGRDVSHCVNRCALTQPRSLRPPDSSGTICFMPDGGYKGELDCNWHIKVTAPGPTRLHHRAFCGGRIAAADR
jgi:hypothetical protein